MVVLDTDHMTMLEWGHRPDTQRLRARLSALPEEDVATTIITYEEQVRGWMAYLAQTRSVAQKIEAYRRLKNQLKNYASVVVLDFDERAAVRLQQLRNERLGVKVMDLHIAAIVLEHDATLLTRNLRDFRKVPGLKIEDWTT
jgi:tRNA(fMet)-specific endonuclease VapC